MESRQKNINNFWAYLLVEELVRNHVTQFFISPGSRSTPLTIAAAENAGAEKIICFDERGAAYCALGYGRATGRPAVLICTSGTAAANYFPALIEARQSQIPMIIISADRPPELQASGANQTIDQSKLYQNYPVWYFDYPCPDLSIRPEMVLTTLDQAIHRTLFPDPGPVHLNLKFREPLEPSSAPFSAKYRQSLKKWQQSSLPYTDYRKSVVSPENSAIHELAGLLNRTRRGILVAGQLPDQRTEILLIDLAAKLHWPVFADITSGIRQSLSDLSMIRYFDHLLLSDKVKKEIKPELILHIGRPLTSKRFLQFVSRMPPGKYVQISQNSERLDPGHGITQRFQGTLSSICKDLSLMVKGQSDKKWHHRLLALDQYIHQLLAENSEESPEITEVTLPGILSRQLIDGHGLFLGNSMPVRDFDMYSSGIPANSRITANRGASGIDGTVASAAGFAAGLKKPVTLVLGDLALIHDLNSLALLATSAYPVTVIVINNQGGGIFSFLPVSGYPHVFESYFATPHNLTFRQAAAMFGLRYIQTATVKEFVKHYKNILQRGKSALIEIRTERENNFYLHHDLQKHIRNSLDKI